MPATLTPPSGTRKRSFFAVDRLPFLWSNVPIWLNQSLLVNRRHNRIGLTLAISSIIFISLGVRVLHWHDSYVGIAEGTNWNPMIARNYQNEARRMREEGRILFPRGEVDPGDARLILHPPGYSAA